MSESLGERVNSQNTQMSKTHSTLLITIEIIKYLLIFIKLFSTKLNHSLDRPKMLS